MRNFITLALAAYAAAQEPLAEDHHGRSTEDAEWMATMEETVDAEANIDDSVTEATNFYGNAAEAAVIADEDIFNWDDHDVLENHKFAEYLSIVKNDGDVTDAAAMYREEYMSYWNEWVAKLPPVCEGGMACREAERVSVRAEVLTEWEAAIDHIKT